MTSWILNAMLRRKSRGPRVKLDGGVGPFGDVDFGSSSIRTIPGGPKRKSFPFTLAKKNQSILEKQCTSPTHIIRTRCKISNHLTRAFLRRRSVVCLENLEIHAFRSFQSYLTQRMITVRLRPLLFSVLVLLNEHRSFT